MGYFVTCCRSEGEQFFAISIILFYSFLIIKRSYRLSIAYGKNRECYIQVGNDSVLLGHPQPSSQEVVVRRVERMPIIRAGSLGCLTSKTKYKFSRLISFVKMFT